MFALFSRKRKPVATVVPVMACHCGHVYSQQSGAGYRAERGAHAYTVHGDLVF